MVKLHFFHSFLVHGLELQILPVINRHKHRISAGLCSAGWGLARATFRVELKKETFLLLASPAEPGAEGGSKKGWAGGDVNCKRKSDFSWIGVGSHCRAIQAGP